MEIGARIRELRILKGLTQEELAGRAELSKSFISQVERDLTSPSIATLVDILQCLGTTIGEFFSEERDCCGGRSGARGRLDRKERFGVRAAHASGRGQSGRNPIRDH